MYEIPDPVSFSDWNEYFVRAVTEKNNTYFFHFLCRYEETLNKNALKFIRRYDLDAERIEDLKQLFSSVLWDRLQSYDPDCGFPFLQLIKFDVRNAWHEYVRTSCGVTSIPTDYTYRLIRKAAQLYYSQSTHDDGIKSIMENMKLTVEKTNEMIAYSRCFKYSDSIVLNEPDDDELFQGVKHEYKLPPSPSAEDDYLIYEQRQKLFKAVKNLSPKETQIIEMSVGVCLGCIGLCDKRTYEQIALLQGAADASVIEKKRKKALKKLRDLLNSNY